MVSNKFGWFVKTAKNKYIRKHTKKKIDQMTNNNIYFSQLAAVIAAGEKRRKTKSEKY